jgi:hypothetical protein
LALRKLVVAFLMHDSIDDVEEHFLVWLNWLITNRATQAADDFEHAITPSFCLYLINIQISSKAHKKAPFE